MAEQIDHTDEELLFQVLSLIGPLSVSLRNDISGFLKIEHYPRKHILIARDSVARKVYFITKGYTRSYFHDRDGREHTLRFSGKMQFLSSVYSFFTRQPALENIETLEKSTLLSITWDQLQIVYGEHPEFNYHGRILTEKYYIQSEIRSLIIRANKPQERYQLFLKYCPDVLHHASLGQVASFIGITQETLSRIRASKDR